MRYADILLLCGYFGGVHRITAHTPMFVFRVCISFLHEVLWEEGKTTSAISFALIGLMLTACRAKTLLMVVYRRFFVYMWPPIVVVRLEEFTRATGCVLHEGMCRFRVLRLSLQLPLHGRRRRSPYGRAVSTLFVEHEDEELSRATSNEDLSVYAEKPASPPRARRRRQRGSRASIIAADPPRRRAIKRHGFASATLGNPPFPLRTPR